MRDYLELTKPRVTWLILMSTAVGYYFGTGAWHFGVLLHTLLGTALLASGTAVLNEWCERETDAKMLRTRQRPILPAEWRRPRRWFRTASIHGGFRRSGLQGERDGGACGLLTLASYLFVYTPLKRRTPHATTVGALTGAMPPLIGYAGAHGALTGEAWPCSRSCSSGSSRTSSPSRGCTGRITGAPASFSCPWWMRTELPPPDRC